MVAALNIVASIALTVVEKKRDLGVLTSMGAAPGALVRIYLTLGAAIGLVGTAAGVAVGIGLSVAADRFRLVPLPSDVYMISHVPFAIHPGEVAACAAFAVATALARGGASRAGGGAPGAGRGDPALAMSMLAIRAENLSKTYTGEGRAGDGLLGALLRALRGDVRRGDGARPASASRRSCTWWAGSTGPTPGRVEIFGQALEKLSPRERARFRNAKVGFVFQFHHLLPEFTAEENVAMPHRIAGVPEGEARRRAGELLERVGLGARRDHGARALSGGEQQRVAIARALARGPGLLLADEPTGNLDAASAQTVFVLLRELHAERGMTTVLVTHNPDLANRCDRLFTMSREGITPSPGLPERG